MLGVLHGAYDAWLTTDVEGQKSWDTIYELEWVESLIRLDHPHLSEEDVEILAEQRLASGYYDEYDF